LRAAAEASLKALGVDAIGLYQFHRPDPKVPYEESVGALAELLAVGKIRPAGISKCQHRADRHRPAGARRWQPGQRAEPVLACVPLQRG
jgi:aryl-alcohol dehydrogenase-like predicted oxidoreductase